MHELFARVAADPANLELRAVLADALQVAGDPRGDFIALQLAIAADVDGNLVSDDARKRVSSLLTAHADAWTADIPELEPASRRFDRGFLVAVHTRAPAAALAASLERPVWATVEELAVDHAPDLARLTKALPLLRAFHAARRDTLVALEELGPHPALRALGAGEGWLPDRDAFPALELLAFRVDAGMYHHTLDPKRARKLLRRVEHLDVAVCRAPLHQVGALLRARDDGPRDLRIACESIHGPFDGYLARGWSIRVLRREARAELAWSGGLGLEQLPPLLDRLADAGIADIEIGIVGTHRQRARELVEDTNVAVRWLPRPFGLTALRPR